MEKEETDKFPQKKNGEEEEEGVPKKGPRSLER